MINQQLLDYVKQQKSLGMARGEIRGALLAQGWQMPEINEALDFSPSAGQPIPERPAMPQTYSSLPEKKSSKIFPAVISAIGGLLIIGGGALAYFYYFPSPEKVLEKMMVKTSEIKTVEYSGEVRAEINAEINYGDFGVESEQSEKTNKFSVSLTGLSDAQDPGNPKSQLVFNLKMDIPNQEEFTFGLETKNLDKVLYLKAGNLPEVPFFDASVLKNQWIKIDLEAIAEQFGDKEIKKQIKKAQEAQNLSPEQTNKIKAVFQPAKIFKITKKLPGENIAGTDTYHYEFMIDTPEFKKFFIEMIRIVQPELATEKTQTGFDKAFSAFELTNGEIWIGKKDYLPYKLSLDLAIKETDLSKTSGRLSFALSLKNFNQPVRIEAPQEFKTIEEIMNGLFGGLKGFSPVNIPGVSLPSVNQPGLNDPQADSDQDGLNLEQEAIYGTDPYNSDTDNDGFKDGDEVKNGYNPNGQGKMIFPDF